MSAGRNAVVGAIEATGVVAVIRLSDPNQVRAVADALGEGGVRSVEVTMSVPRAAEVIETLATSLPSDFIVGAGTVLNPETARQVIDAGARFVVGPVLRVSVIEVCHEHDVPAMPGCFSPTEILDAWQAGADVVKVFPAAVLGPGFFRDLRGPLPQIPLLPTGGVTCENAGDWIRSGAIAVGVGTSLVDPKAVAIRRFDVITANARRFVEAVQRARAGETADV